MVHKRYVMKRGRLHGPYYYESYREDGKVKKRYIGTSLPRRRIGILPIVLVVLGILIVGNFVYLGMTGKTIEEQIDDVVGTVQEATGAVDEVVEEPVSDEIVWEEGPSEEEIVWEGEVAGEIAEEETVEDLGNETDILNDTSIEVNETEVGVEVEVNE